MRILHTYCLNHNIGDYALGIGLKNLLREYIKVDFIGDTNIQGRVFDEYYIKEVVNKKYDLLVIGGGGIIHGAHWPNGWFWLIDIELIKEIEIPYVIYGVGYNYWLEEDMPERGKTHLIETEKNAAYFSVRNDGSATRLFERTGIRADITPDPGFHVDLNTTYRSPENNPFVIIQLANDKPLSRFSSIKNQEEFVRDMRAITKSLSKKYKVIFIPHVLEDVEISENVAKNIGNTEVLDFGNFAFDRANKVIAYYKYAEFVIAMRGHGQILPIAFNTPAISLENHPKHSGLMEELGLLDYSVKVNEADFLNILLQKINMLQKNLDTLKDTYAEINASLDQKSKSTFVKIISSLK